MHKRVVLGAGLAAVALLAMQTGASPMQQVPMVRLQAQTEVAVPPAVVWRQLTHGQSLVTWCPAWKAPGNARVNLARIGDTLDFTDAYGNGGRSVVTYLDPNKELRVVHEPSNGSYICQARITLAAVPAGTQLRYVESYTDESKPSDMQATADKTAAEIQRTLAALKQAAEKK